MICGHSPVHISHDGARTSADLSKRALLRQPALSASHAKGWTPYAPQPRVSVEPSTRSVRATSRGRRRGRRPGASRRLNLWRLFPYSQVREAARVLCASYSGWRPKMASWTTHASGRHGSTPLPPQDVAHGGRECRDARRCCVPSLYFSLHRELEPSERGVKMASSKAMIMRY